ncbi:hypothetical protein [Bacillus cereus]|uniref:hypothetical protein n=1 Tax=Bacillus cereus TaxID=1396 RepID=UPI000B4B48A6|nr:hypothetical protein [Bacillus cereus]
MKKTIHIPSNLKISLSMSMRNQVKCFLRDHKGNIKIYKTEEDLLDSLFFYWVRNSSRKKYKWLHIKNINEFLNTYVLLLKNRLKTFLNENEYLRSGNIENL